MSGDFFGTPSRRVRGQPRTPDGLPDSEVDNPPERRSSPRFAPKYVVQRRRWRQAHIQEAATTDEKRKAKKLLKNVDEVAPEIADGLAIALERIVDIIDERYRQEAIKKAITARKETNRMRKRKAAEAAAKEAQHQATAASKQELRDRLASMTPAPLPMWSMTNGGVPHHSQRGTA